MKEKTYWFQHPAINNSWVVEQVYQSRSRTHTSRFAMKAKKGKFTVAEIEAIEAARQRLVGEVDAPS